MEPFLTLDTRFISSEVHRRFSFSPTGYIVFGETTLVILESDLENSEVKLCLFADGMTHCVENLEELKPGGGSTSLSS